MTNNREDIINKLTDDIVKTYSDDKGINFIEVTNLPVRERILEVLDLLIELLFPGYTGKRSVTTSNIKFIVGDILCLTRSILLEQIELALKHKCRMKDCPTHDCNKMADKVTDEFLARLPAIREMLKGDIKAAFKGDPAAESLEEVVIGYPYITAIATHRIAHELYLRDIPMIPRIMSENAHSKTGIDIHPGARIGKNFFIDHGTGVVIGESSLIGDNVKFYQGVSLIAVSIPKDAQSIKGGKRHPTIEDDVTIYAEATILGDITIGKASVIGGNVWIKKSVPPETTVAIAKPELLYKHYKHNDKHKK